MSEQSKDLSQKNPKAPKPDYSGIQLEYDGEHYVFADLMLASERKSAPLTKISIEPSAIKHSGLIKVVPAEKKALVDDGVAHAVHFGGKFYILSGMNKIREAQRAGQKEMTLYLVTLDYVISCAVTAKRLTTEDIRNSGLVKNENFRVGKFNDGKHKKHQQQAAHAPRKSEKPAVALAEDATDKVKLELAEDARRPLGVDTIDPEVAALSEALEESSVNSSQPLSEVLQHTNLSVVEAQGDEILNHVQESVEVDNTPTIVTLPVETPEISAEVVN